MIASVDTNGDEAAARTTRAWLVTGTIAFVLWGLLTWLIAIRVSLPFDQQVLDLARSWDGLSPLWNFVSDAANFPMIGIGVGLVVWFLWHHQLREAVAVIILLGLATVGSELVKEIVARPRPIKGPEIGVPYSYASGHVLEALTILGIISLLVWRSHRPLAVRAGVAIVVVALVALVGIARMALGEHYPTDVIGGALAGAGTLSIFAAVTSEWRAEKRGLPSR